MPGTRQVDLNKANADELMNLSGIDLARARLIIEYREKHGPFERWEDVEAVPGLGQVLGERVRTSATLGEPATRKTGTGNGPRRSSNGDKETKMADKQAKTGSGKEGQKGAGKQTKSGASKQPQAGNQTKSGASKQAQAGAGNQAKTDAGKQAKTARKDEQGEGEETAEASSEESQEAEEAGLTQDEVAAMMAVARLDFEAAMAYESVAETAEAPELREMLTGFAGDHRRHVDEITDFVEELGISSELEPPRPEGSAMLALATTLAALDPDAALEAMIANEQLTNGTYETAAWLFTDESALAIIERGREDEQRHLSTLLEYTGETEAEEEP